MHRRSTGALTQILSTVSPAVSRVEAQRGPHADFWDAWNQRAANEDGPLWVALGDSSTQGIGSEDPLDGWVPQVLDRLRDDTGEPWRVINLAITGAQFGDIVEYQLPRIAELRAAGHESAVMTHLAGANNLMAPNTWAKATEHLRTILDALIPGSVVARVGIDSPGNSAMARKFNRTISSAAADKDFDLFWPWSWPSRDGMGGDKFHPGPKGYGYMADIIHPRLLAAIDKN